LSTTSFPTRRSSDLEGTRGAKSMVEADAVKGVDYFIAIHIGTGVPQHHFVAANNGFLATSKLDVTFNGTASHAGSKPEEGQNSLDRKSTRLNSSHVS